MEKIYKRYFLEHLRKSIAIKSLLFTNKEDLENILAVVGATLIGGGVAEHRIVKSPGLKGSGLFLFLQISLRSGLSSIRIMF